MQQLNVSDWDVQKINNTSASTAHVNVQFGEEDHFKEPFKCFFTPLLLTSTPFCFPRGS